MHIHSALHGLKHLPKFAHFTLPLHGLKRLPKFTHTAHSHYLPTITTLPPLAFLHAQCTFFSLFGRVFLSNPLKRAIFRSRSVRSKFFFIIPTPTMFTRVHMALRVSNIVLLFQISFAITPRTPPKVRKFLCLRFSSKSHGSCKIARWVHFCNPFFDISTRSWVIHVFVSFYYVNWHIFAMRAHLRPLFFIFVARYELPTRVSRCTVLPLDF